MAVLALVEKTPGAVLTYTIDWTAWLPGSDTISSVSWTVPAGITNALESNTAYKASIKLSGGTAGSEYDVKCTITTVGGLIDSRTLRFLIVEK